MRSVRAVLHLPPRQLALSVAFFSSFALLFILPFSGTISFPLQAAQYPPPTNVGGILTGDTRWTLSGSPYRLTNHVSVPPGVVLTIDPGVVVEANADWLLEVAGTLRALGTAVEPITFRKTSTNDAGWLGLRFVSGSVAYDETTGGGSVVQYATIRDMSDGGSAVSLSNASPLLTNLDVVNYRNSGVVGSAQAGRTLWVRRSRIHDGNLSPLSLSGAFVAEGNELFNNAGGQTCAVSVSNGTFRYNFVHDNGGTSLAICPGTGARVENNTIVDNGAVGIALQGGSGQVLTANTIGGHSLNLAVMGEPSGVTVRANNFVGPLSTSPSDPCMPLPRQYHVAVFNNGCGVFGGAGGSTPYMLDLQANFWDTTDAGQIEQAVRDNNDDLTLYGTVNVSPFLTTATNILPVSNAGPDQTVTGGTTGVLSSAGSTDPDGDRLTLNWYQISGPAVVLADPETDSPSFVAPNDGTLVFALTVHDGRGGFARDTVHVNAPVITWPTPADIVYGTALSGTQLNATANVAGTFAYTPAAGTVLGAGNGQTLSVTFTPNDPANYTNTTKTVTIDVLKATPVITWPTPADILSGTALGTTQLNATANVSGSFAYAPPAGTVVGAGNAQALSLTFMPSDAANYTSATASVLINVQPRLDVTVLAPNGGERVFDGSPYLIQWMASGGLGGPSGFDVAVSTDGGTTYSNLAGCTGLTGVTRSCQWTPSASGPTSALIRATGRDGAGNTDADVSDARFTISPSSPQIRVTAPNGAASWTIGETQRITWGHNLGTGAFVRLELTRNGGAIWQLLAASVPSATARRGTFDWVVTGPATSNALIRATWTGGGTSATSPRPFSIVNPVVTITAPNTGVVWSVGTTRAITWRDNLGVDQTMNIDISRDGGLTWSRIASSVANGTGTSGRFDWAVTGPPTSAARIRVSSASNPAVSDSSAVDFRIR